jgi:signal transduction histidine kinase
VVKQKNFYTHKKQWKLLLLIVALIIGGLSLTFTNQLVKQLEEEERKRIELWAEATRFVASYDDLDQEISFYVNVITNNKTIPVILTKQLPDKTDSIVSYLNISSDNPKNLKKRLAKMRSDRPPIVIELLDGEKNFIYYDDSTILKKLSVYPYIQLGAIGIFILLAYLAFSSSRKAEQNQVWVGMSKETAHQLGTPISSLMAWVEILEENEENKSFVPEMAKDVNRLQMIAERFSKIGSLPELPLTDLQVTLKSAINYMKTRTSKNINFRIYFNTQGQVLVPLNKALFHWVIENLVKNSVDAMEGKGDISVYLVENDKEAIIKITDTGKGIPKSKQKLVFNPGYTSKDRGWGLGLSLARRIIENYHKGKIGVESSEINEGTTFKIVLPKLGV